MARDRLLGRPCFLSPSKNILVNSPIDEENPHPPKRPKIARRGTRGIVFCPNHPKKKKDRQQLS